MSKVCVWGGAFEQTLQAGLLKRLELANTRLTLYRCRHIGKTHLRFFRFLLDPQDLAPLVL